MVVHSHFRVMVEYSVLATATALLEPHSDTLGHMDKDFGFHGIIDSAVHSTSRFDIQRSEVCVIRLGLLVAQIYMVLFLFTQIKVSNRLN
jgi:phosphotransferase system  glucose/maltose/N-acetylglucosamine-specific IIC component